MFFLVVNTDLRNSKRVRATADRVTDHPSE